LLQPVVTKVFCSYAVDLDLFSDKAKARLFLFKYGCFVVANSDQGFLILEIAYLIIIVLVTEDVQFDDSIQNRLFSSIVQGVGHRRITTSGNGEHFGTPKMTFHESTFVFLTFSLLLHI